MTMQDHQIFNSGKLINLIKFEANMRERRGYKDAELSATHPHTQDKQRVRTHLQYAVASAASGCKSEVSSAEGERDEGALVKFARLFCST